jgi:uncharacterized protein YdeI (YjbR/CyaY-like superfamily)
MNPEEILKQMNFSTELLALRKIILSTGLEETIKWGTPVYTYEGKNVVGIAGFKEHFGVWFYQGVLLKDPQKKLINAQAGKTMALRQWRMASKKDIDKRVLSAYIREAIHNEKKGLRIASRKPVKKAPVLPPELKSAMSSSKKLATAFSKLTPGRQKEYAEFIAGAKQMVTRKTRVEKIKPMILAGAGLNDKYSRKKNS